MPQRAAAFVQQIIIFSVRRQTKTKRRHVNDIRCIVQPPVQLRLPRRRHILRQRFGSLVHDFRSVRIDRDFARLIAVQPTLASRRIVHTNMNKVFAGRRVAPHGDAERAVRHDFVRHPRRRRAVDELMVVMAADIVAFLVDAFQMDERHVFIRRRLRAAIDEFHRQKSRIAWPQRSRSDLHVRDFRLELRHHRR